MTTTERDEARARAEAAAARIAELEEQLDEARAEVVRLSAECSRLHGSAIDHQRYREKAEERARKYRQAWQRDLAKGREAIARRAGAARDAVASIIESNENAPRDPFYEAKVREIGAHACGAIMRAARHVWLDMLRDEYGLADGAHTIGPALPVLRRAIGLATGGSVEPLPPRLPADYDAGGE